MWILVGIFGFVVLLCVLVYLPPVQKFAVGKVSEIVSEKTGMHLSVEQFRLRCPIGVSLVGATLSMPQGDTLAGAGSAKVSVALLPLLSGQVIARDISLEEVHSTWRDTVSEFGFRARLKSLAIGRVSLDPSEMSVRVSRVVLRGADVALVLGGSSDIPEKETVAAPPWIIDVGRFKLSDSRFTMDAPSLSPSVGAPFDPSHIRLGDVELVVRDVRYAGTEVSARLEKLGFAERSGLRVVSGEGDFAMTPDEISLIGFGLATERSQIKVDAKAGGDVLGLEEETPVSLDVSATLGADDILPVIPVTAEMKRAFAGKTVTVDAAVEGTFGDVSLKKLALKLPGNFDFRAQGKLREVTEPEKLSGEFSFEGRTENLDFAKRFIADTAFRSRIAIPRGMTLQGRGRFSPDNYELSALTLASGAGHLEAKGRFGMREGIYDADLRLIDFPVGDFMPHDSLGAATLSLMVNGRGFDPAAGMVARAGLSIDSLVYGTKDLGKVVAEVSIDNGVVAGTIESHSELLVTAVTLDGRMERDPLPASSRAAALSMRYDLSASIDSTAIFLGEGTYRIAPTNISASASGVGISATVRSGDFSLEASSPLGLDSLVIGAQSMAGEVQRQLAARHFSAEGLQSASPGLMLKARAGRENFIRDMAVANGFDFRTVSADLSTVPGTPFGMEATVTGLGMGQLVLDTLGVNAFRRGDNLDYLLRMKGHPSDNDGNLGLIEVSGSASGNTLSADIFQRNINDSVGFRFGVSASLDGKIVRVRMTSPEPVLGYERWSVVQGADWLEYDVDGKFRADLHINGPRQGEYVKLTSATLPDIPDGALRLQMAGLPLGPMLSLFPTAPPLDGTAFSDVTFGLLDGWARPEAAVTPTRRTRGAAFAGRLVADSTRRVARRPVRMRSRRNDSVTIIAAKGTLGVGNFSYNGRRVADIDANLDFQSDTEARMVITADVSLDKKTALTVRGFYNSRVMNLALSVPAVPLSIAEGFLPSGTASLSGNINGQVRVTGELAKPVLTGEVGIEGGKVDVEMIGTAFDVSPDRITIADGRLAFNNFGIIAPNRQKLAIDGNIDFSDLLRTSADLVVSAKNFQLVDSKHIGGSQVYGNAAFDAAITAKGPLSGLRVRGDVSLSDATSIVYILRNQSRVRDEKQHIVEFKVFTDTLPAVELDTLPRFGAPKVDMLVGVKIPGGVKATLSLDELNENRVELIGGGDLVYSMNAQGDARLTGRYTLSGGTLWYRPPVIPQKIFAVRDGSYVEWAGEIGAPQFHVSATQTSDITIDHDEGFSEQVEFDISIDISGSLAAMDMGFDLAAPGNLAIQNQILAMSREQRMQQALTLLVYEQYTGPGVSSQKKEMFDARATLNNFISKEVNQWARNNLKGVDFSMGISSAGTEGVDSHNDYSYSVSKTMFSGRVKMSIGGSVADNATSQNFADNLLDDVILEYRLTEHDNMLLKVYRTTTRESILEGEVTETGGGFIMRRKISRFGDLFRRNRSKK